MIRTVLRFPLKPGAASQLVDAFDRFGIFDESLATPGCRSVEMSISVDESEALVTATWEDLEAYRRWTNRESKGAHRSAFNELLSAPITSATIGAVYTVAYPR